MRFLLSTLLLMLMGWGLTAQTTCEDYLIYRQGSYFEMTNYDKKDRVTSLSTHQVTDVQGEGNGFTASIESAVQDEDGEELYEGTYEVGCADGTLLLDASAMINPAVLQSYYEMDMEIEGEGLKIPASLSEGQELPDATTKISVSTSGLKIMTMTFSNEDRVVERRETIETPAGTFDCWVISQEFTMDAGLVKRSFKTVDWYSEGVGVVKSETYDSKDRLDSYTLLTKFEK